MWNLVWLVTVLFNGNDGLEATDRLVPPGWQGNPWGPAANHARATGEIPPIVPTADMKRWDAWGKATLRDGDILFRRADARILLGRFQFSKFIADASGSAFSHTGIVAIEPGGPVVYDTTKAGVRRQPFAVWMLDDVGAFGVKRLRPEKRAHVAQALAYCRDVYERQIPFDFDLKLDDSALYCVEMTEKAFRASGLTLSEPIRLGDMEHATDYPVSIFLFVLFSKLRLDQEVFFPGNEHHGIWSSPDLVTVHLSVPPPAPRRPRRPSSDSPSDAGAVAREGASSR